MKRLIWKENYPLLKQLCKDSNPPIECKIIGERIDPEGDTQVIVSIEKNLS